ncbi:MAG: hypothetical protein JW910_05860, partial [Anaerolineae bacterium]|nr:hypothetical protein [Anaerolineae bacterium]
TPTATPTFTPNATVTAEWEAFLTQAAAIQATQFALETRLAPSGTPDRTATTVFQGTIIPTLAAQRAPRSEASAYALCSAAEQLVLFSDFRDLLLIPSVLPGGFLSEQIDGDAALHVTQTGYWQVDVPLGYLRTRFDMFVPPAGTPPLTVSFAAGRVDAAWTGWQMTWSLTDDPATTGIQVQWVRGGVPVAVSSLLRVPFNTWITVELALQPFTAMQNIATLRVLAPDGPRTVSLDVSTLSLTPFNTVVIGGTVDSGPWLDNLLICHRPNPLYFTPTPSP